MKKVKVRNIKTKIEKEVTELLASELIGTHEWEVVKESSKSIFKNSESKSSSSSNVENN